MGQGNVTGRRADRMIAELAAKQHGLVTAAQLRVAGVTPETVRWRVRTGWLEAVHRGVYRVGPVPAARSREMAALLACGPLAVVSGCTALVLWRAGLDHVRGGAAVDIAVPGGSGVRTRPGIRVHRVAALPPEDVAELDGIRITTVTRSIIDAACVLRPRELRRVVAVAVRDHGLDAGALEERCNRGRGSAVLRALLRDGVPSLTRSEAETKLLDLVTRARLPRPDVNVRVDGMEVDFLWRSERVVVEVDGYAYHGSRSSFEGDRRRDADLVAQGYRVMRVTWQQLTREAEATLARITRALALAEIRG